MDTTTLRFHEDPDREIVMRVSGVPLRAYFEIQEYDLRWTRDSFEGLCSLLAPFVVSLGPDLTPDEAGLLSLDPNIVGGVFVGWLKGVRDVPLPLPLGPSDGRPSEPETSPPSLDEPSSAT